MTETVARRDEPDPCGGDGAALDFILRLAASTFDASLAALVCGEGRARRVVARLGLVEAADAAVVREAMVLAASPSGEASPSRPTDGLRLVAGAPVGLSGEAPAGVLLVLAREPFESPAPSQVRALRDLARFAAHRCRSAVLDLEGGCPATDALAADTRLRDAVDAVPEGIAIFDRDDRFVIWNREFEHLYGGEGIELRRGLRFEDHLRSHLARGSVLSARGREDAWLAERLARYAAAEGAHEHQLAGGRWVRVQDRRLSDGGRIGIRIDVTELKTRERSFRLLFDANPVPMIVYDRETLGLLAANDAALAFYGHEREAFLRLTLFDTRPEREHDAIRAYAASDYDEKLLDRTWVHLTAHGVERMVRVSAKAMEHEGRKAMLAAIFDVTEQRRIEDEVRSTRAFLKHVVDNIPTAVFAKDMWNGGRYVIYNRAGEELVGRSSASIIGQIDRDIFGREEAERFIRQDKEALRHGTLGTIEEEAVSRPDGSTRSIRTRKVAIADGPDGLPRYVLGVAEDITERRLIEARIAHMAHHDALTDLPNRVLFLDRLESALARARRLRERLAVLFLDLDGFKGVNDARGHAAGDALLRAIGDRLRGAIRATDTAARLGGDEFGILQTPIRGDDEPEQFAGRLISLLSASYAIDGHEVCVGASIGIAMAPLDGLEPDVLLRRADTALYRSKRDGRNAFRFFDHAPGLATPPLARRAS